MMAPGVVVEQQARAQENATWMRARRLSPSPPSPPSTGLAYGRRARARRLLRSHRGRRETFAWRAARGEARRVSGQRAAPIRVTRRVGEGRAKEMMFLGEPIDAETAHTWGLINRVVPPGAGPRGRVRAWRPRSPQRPRAGACRSARQAVDLAWDMPEAEAVRRTLAAQRPGLQRARIASEGVRAFLAKEPPRFAR